MVKNEYVPRGLPLISDHVLIKTYREYQHARLLLGHTSTSASVELKKKLDEALDVIQEELQARGVDVPVATPTISVQGAPRTVSYQARKHRGSRANTGYSSSNLLSSGSSVS